MLLTKRRRHRHPRHTLPPGTEDTNPWAGNTIYDTSVGPQDVTLMQQLGPVVTGLPIQLIFWGTTYSNNTDNWSAIAAAAFTIVTSSFGSKLSQYSSEEGTAAIGTQILPPIFIDSDPPSAYADSDLANQAQTLYQNGQLGPITPIRDGSEGFASTLPVLVLPSNASYSASTDDSEVLGAHPSVFVGDVNMPFAWIAFAPSDIMTVALSHEIVEMVTDPFADWDPAVLTSNCGGPYGQFAPEPCEIADDGFEWCASISGVLLTSYWSNEDSECVVPGAFDTQKYGGSATPTDTIATPSGFTSVNPSEYVTAPSGQIGDFYAVVPNRGPTGGLVEFSASNTSGTPVWSPVGLIDAGLSITGCCLIETNYQTMQVLATCQGALFWYNVSPGGGVSSPSEVALGDWASNPSDLNPPLVTIDPSSLNPLTRFFGTPGIVQGNVGARGDYEVVALSRGGSIGGPLVYFRGLNDWVGPDQPTDYPIWSGPTVGDLSYSSQPLVFGQGLTFDDLEGGSVALVQAQFFSYQNDGIETIAPSSNPAEYTLHAIVRTSWSHRYLYHFYKGAPPPNYWVNDFDANGNLAPISVSGSPISGVVGDFGFIEIDRVFLLAAAFVDGSVRVFVRQNSGSDPLVWTTYTESVPVVSGGASVSLMKTGYASNLFSKRVEMLVVTSGWTTVQHLYLADDMQWTPVGAAFGNLNQ